MPGRQKLSLWAMSYSTGEIWQRKQRVSWVVVALCNPYLTGNVNYVITGMAYGMIARKVFPEGKVLISIPWNWIPIITQNLKEMKWMAARIRKPGTL